MNGHMQSVMASQQRLFRENTQLHAMINHLEKELEETRENALNDRSKTHAAWAQSFENTVKYLISSGIIEQNSIEHRNIIALRPMSI